MFLRGLAALLVVSGMAAAGEPSAAVRGEVVANADFFQRNERDEPTGWRIRHTDPEMKRRDDSLVKAENETLRLGGPALRGEILLIQPNIPLTPGKRYRVAFRARGVGDVASLRVYVQYQAPRDGVAKPVAVNDAWKRVETEWREQAFTVDFPDNGRGAWLVINVSGAVAVELGDLAVTVEE